MSSFRETYETHEPPEVEIRVAAGEIRLASHDAPETQVEIEPLDDAAADLLSSVRVDLRGGAAGPALLVDIPDKRAPRLTIEHGDRMFGFLHRTPSFAVRIAAPHGARASIRTKSADLESTGRLGSLEVRSESGDLDAADVDGRVAVQTASGDVRLGRAGAVELNTVSGDIRVGHVEREARVNTVSGDIELRRVDGPADLKSVSGDHRLAVTGGCNVALQAVSGDIAVGIAPGVDVWLDVRSMSGDTSSDLEGAEGPGGESPSIELRANTVSGDVRIHRATVAV